MKIRVKYMIYFKVDVSFGRTFEI